jgi:hypothetical protein
MGNYSTDPVAALQIALSRGYSRVRFQQGKPILDRELNLAADLASCERLAQQYIGDGVPAGSTGFQITGLNVAAGDFSILPGICRVGGLEIVLANPTTYRTQPNTGLVGPLPAGASNVYLHVFTDEVAAAQDADLGNTADVGTETSLRGRNNWEVVVSVPAVNDASHFLLATIDTTANTVGDLRRTNLTLAVLKDEITAARGNAAALPDRLNKTLAADGTMLAGTASIQKMASTLIVNAQFSVPAAPGPGQTGEQAISLLNTDDPAFLLVSVHFDGPRNPGFALVPLSQIFDWHQRVVLVKPVGSTTFSQHVYQVLVQNPNTFAISVTCKAYRLAEV